MKHTNLYALITLLGISSCGTIFSGSEQIVQFDSNIKGTAIYINGFEACKTPCTYPIARQSSSTIITAKKEGYEEKQIVLRSSLNTVAILNLTLWPSWLTDVATGGMWQYSRDGVYIDMEKTNLKNAALEQAKRKTAIRRFSLFNYAELKIAAASNNKSNPHIKALAALSQKSPQEIIPIVNSTFGEVNLAHALATPEI